MRRLQARLNKLQAYVIIRFEPSEPVARGGQSKAQLYKMTFDLRSITSALRFNKPPKLKKPIFVVLFRKMYSLDMRFVFENFTIIALKT